MVPMFDLSFNSLAEPKSGFKIAFNMFDTDGNQRVDKDEFLVVSMIRSKVQFYFHFFGAKIKHRDHDHVIFEGRSMH